VLRKAFFTTDRPRIISSSSSSSSSFIWWIFGNEHETSRR
jgi:hypothetical protein